MKFFTPNLTGTPTNADVGVHDVNLTVSDGNGGTTTQNFQITVANVNDAPVLTQVVDQSVSEDFITYTLELNATDIDSPSLVYSADTNDTNLVNISLSGTTLSITSVANANGIARVDYNVTDGNLTTAKSFTITVNAVDDAPTFAALQNLNTFEDGNDFNVTLSVTDVEGNAITYLVTSSNANIATASIVDGVLVITHTADGFGLVNIEVNATANGLSSLQDFNISVASVNDAPSIDTTLANLSILEDVSSFSVDINISDIDGDDLNLTVESNNTNILTVTPNWTNILNQGDYASALDFNLTTVADANGIVRITVTNSDASLSTSQIFDINVTAVNDSPTLSSISNLIVYLNSGDQNITLDGADIDSASLNYTSDFNSSLISSINFAANVMQITPVAAAGTTDINITLSDGDLNTSIDFTFTTIALEDGDDVEQVGNIEQNATTTEVTIDNNLTLTVYDNNNGIVKHAVEVSSTTTSANTSLLGALVEIISNGVKITYDDNVNAIAEVVATVLGEAIHTMTVGSDVTKVTFKSPGTTSVIEQSSSGDVKIISTLKTSDGSITVLAHADGSAQYSVNVGGNTSSFTSSIVGTTTVVQTNGDVKSTVGAYTDGNGYLIKAVVTTYANGTNGVKLIRVNDTNSSDSSDFKTVSSDTYPLPAGTTVSVFEASTVLYINIKLKLNGSSFIVQP